MNLYIRIQNGQPVDHPIMEDNFIQAFPEIDINNLPPEFARFTRIQQPALNVYEVYEGVTYELIDGSYADVHHVRPMTNEEKQQKQQEARDLWAASLGFSSWVFDEELCAFVAPIAYPTDGGNYFWNEETQSWDVDANT